MADKEGRILITQWNINYDICTAPTEYQCGTSKSCDDCKVGMTRQEAINSMAKAIYTFEIIACSHDECGNKQCENCETWKWCENIAEAALNALLEDKK